MPLVAHNNLPSFQRLAEEGQIILPKDHALHQDIRELHIGLLNIMPDTALTATERQFFRLIGQSNAITQIYIHPFTLRELKRGTKARKHIEKYYANFDDIQQQGLDALIITGANASSVLSDQPFWQPLIDVVSWADKNVPSTLCSCLATHALMEFRYGQKRIRQPEKTWGVFPHYVADKSHPLVNGINTRLDVPHSRWNKITRQQCEKANCRILIESAAGIHLVTSPDGIRFVMFQGHPEYDTISLLKEYKRDLLLYANGDNDYHPPSPANFFNPQAQAIIEEYKQHVFDAVEHHQTLPELPEHLITPLLDNTWHDSAVAVIGNWIGGVYRITHNDRSKRYMDHIDPNDPLELGSS